MNKPKRVLLVEDDTDDSDFFVEVLHDIDPAVSCLVIDNGPQALRLLHVTRHLPRLIFLDYDMPCMNGVEFLREIKKEEVLKLIPVIVLTTSANFAEQCYEAGAHLYVRKPSLVDAYHTLLSDILNHDWAKDAQPLREKYTYGEPLG